MIGASVFPDKFRGLVAMGRVVLAVTPLEERGTESPKFMAPSAEANVVGSAKAIASAIVASFMTCSFSFENGNIGRKSVRSIKKSVSSGNLTPSCSLNAEQIKSNLVAPPGRASISASCASTISCCVDRMLDGV
jgi:hypothetical protein